MFGLVSKKKLAKVLKLVREYNDNSKVEGDTEEARVKDFYYRSGNTNAVNYICSKLGITIR